MNRLANLLHDRVVSVCCPAVGRLVLVGQVFVWFPRYALHPPAPDDGLDFRIYQRAAARARTGLSLTNRAPTPPKLHPAACSTRPPSQRPSLPPDTFHRLPSNWGVPRPAGRFWAYAAGLVKLARGRPAASDTLSRAGGALFLTPGLNITMSLGNLDLVVWAMVAWGLTRTDGAAPAAARRR